MNTEQPHKRYLVFEVIDYYPSGGMGDLVATFNTTDEVIEYLVTRFTDDYSIYDRIEGIEINLTELMKNENKP